MVQQTGIVVNMAILSLILGVAGSVLFRDSSGTLLGSAGPNLFVWIALALIALAILAARAGVKLDAEGRWLAVPLCFFAASFMIVGSSFLQFWNGVLMAVSALLLIVRCRGPWRLTVAGYTEYLRLLTLGVRSIIAGPLALLRSDLKIPPGIEGNPSRSGSRILIPLATVVKGGLLSIIPITVFGALFVNADPVFDRFVQRLFDWNFATFASYAIWSILFGLLACGALRTALLLDPIPDQAERSSISPSRVFFSTSDIVFALALINLLFALFVAFQFKFLFGGETIIQNVPGLTYASYARGGFFELAWVASLALPLLLRVHWLTRSEVGQPLARVKAMTLILVGLLLVVVASAFKRMWLYEFEWGLTEKRLLVTVFIGAITLVLFWFLATVWRGQPRRFAFGLLVASMLTVGCLDISNPDAIVVRTDTARAQGLRYFGACYLDGLGSDAVPGIVAGIHTMAAAEQSAMAYDLLDEWTTVPRDWRTYNRSVAAAHDAVVAHKAMLKVMAAQYKSDNS